MGSAARHRVSFVLHLVSFAAMCERRVSYVLHLVNIAAVCERRVSAARHRASFKNDLLLQKRELSRFGNDNTEHVFWGLEFWGECKIQIPK